MFAMIIENVQNVRSKRNELENIVSINRLFISMCYLVALRKPLPKVVPCLTIQRYLLGMDFLASVYGRDHFLQEC